MSEQNPLLAKRQKIKKACDICRLRKIKCDGEQPCGKCRSSGAECLYTYVEKKRQVTKKEDKVASIQGLDHRMNRMENLITTLIDKLNSPRNSPMSDNSPSGARLSSSVINSPSNDDQDQYVKQENSDEVRTSKDVYQPVVLNIGNIETKFEEKYIGSQSSLSVLSPNGFLWLAKKAHDPTITNQFQNLINNSHGVFYDQMKRWLEPIDSNQVCQLPARETMDSLMRTYETDPLQISFFMPLNEVRELIGLYYNIQEKKKRHNRLTNSDLLVLNVVVAIAANLQFEQHPGDRGALLALKELEDKHINNAIYYYNKVSIIGEGLRTVQGILLLFSHTSFSLLPQANFMLISSAIRLSQGLGLHRVESLVGLSDDEKCKRRRIWWWAYLADRTDCLKGGKPLTITDVDISPMDLAEFRYLTFQDFPKDLLDQILSGQLNLMDYKIRLESSTMPFNISLIISYYVTCFFKFTGEAYENLFCATALIGKNADQIMDIIETLNVKLEALNETIPLSIRPGAPLRLGVFEAMVDDKLLMLHFTYYIHVMIINRMAFKRSWLNHDQETADDNSTILPRQSKSIMKCLDAARTILKIVQQMNACKISNFNLPVFVFSSAFFTILTACLEFPESNQTKNDLILIQHTSNVLFSKLIVMSNQLGDEKVYKFMSHVIKFFLRIGILVYNNSNVDKIDPTDLDKELKDYQASCKTESPSKKRKHEHMNHPRKTSHVSPPQPSPLSHIRSTNPDQQHVPPITQDLYPGAFSSRRSSQANTPNLNNILNNPVTQTVNTASHNGIPDESINNSTWSVSSGEAFDPLQMSDMDQMSANNVFQQLFPMPNLYFNGGNPDVGDPNSTYLGHFEW